MQSLERLAVHLLLIALLIGVLFFLRSLWGSQTWRKASGRRESRSQVIDRMWQIQYRTNDHQKSKQLQDLEERIYKNEQEYLLLEAELLRLSSEPPKAE